MDGIPGQTKNLPTLEELQEAAKSPDYFHFVGLYDPFQPGVRLLFALLQNAHYPPETPRGEKLIVVIIEWVGQKWVIISLPRAEVNFLEEIAPRCELQVDQGGPQLGNEDFPIKGNGSNVFTLMTPLDHLLLCGDDGQISAMIHREFFQVLALDKGWKNRN
ncbi:MAG TPA: hypothetical protein VK254_01395 [Candidatus Bathyarchaeia archaeon]|nr:hypothetical protein [Candidatus Bathyarchaeia archaeon]